MAKDQDLPLNPSKISGVCGRLLCCLSYEHEQYLEIKAELPRKGAWVQTPDGPGEVVAVNVVRETVSVELAGSGVHEEYSPAQISAAAQRVGDVARSRAAEGVAPFAGLTPLPPRERRDPAERPRREPKQTGEKRLLRDTMDDPEVLEALALLEEGFEEHAEPAPEPTRAEASSPPPAKSDRGPRDQRHHQGNVHPRRQDQPPRPAPQAQPRTPQGAPARSPMPAAERTPPGQPPAERSHEHRRRRRRGGRHGGER
jgi:hypothetical protein